MKKPKKVKYTGNITAFQNETYKVFNVIHDGEPIGNGETNNRGDDMYVCQEDKQGVPGFFLFRKDEVTPV